MPGCYQQIDSWLVQSQNAGRTWSAPRKLNGQSMQIEWLADTSLGAMLGDYISVSYVQGEGGAGGRARRPALRSRLQRVDLHLPAQEPAPRTPAAISSQCRRPSP